jgi:hypothetical protein
MCAVVAAALGATSVAAAQAPALVDDFGHWDLARLGAEPLDLPVRPGRASRSLKYRLPADANQGPDRWYLLRLSFKVELDPATGSGSIFVDGSTNGHTAVSVEIEVTKQSDGRLRIVQKTLDLTKGARQRVSSHRTVTGTSVSFLQNRGVRPGKGVLSFELEHYGDVSVRRARILADSGLVVSRRSPASLRLTPRLPRETVVVGEAVKVGYLLENVGDRPAMDVVVGMRAHDRSMRVRHPRRVRIGRLENSRAGHFTVEPRRPGRQRLTLAAGASNANNPVTELEVDVPRAARQTGSLRRSAVRLRSLRTRMAALCPPAAITPPPGCVPAPHR